MEKIRYNLADHRRIHIPAVAGFFMTGIVVAGALLLIGLAVFRHQSEATAALQRQIAETRGRCQALSAQADRFRRETTQNKQRWEPEITRANALIAAKTYSYLHVLDFFETILPEGTQVANLSLRNGQADRLSFTVRAAGFDQLMELYSRLSPMNMTVTGEGKNESQGAQLFYANLSIRYPHGK